jgi:hypothetical protein
MGQRKADLFIANIPSKKATPGKLTLPTTWFYLIPSFFHEINPKMRKPLWIRGQYYFGDSELESRSADAETDTKALLPHPKENNRRPKFWKSFLGIKDKMLDVGLSKTEESSISENEFVSNPRRRRSRILFWRRTHMLLKEVPSMDSSLSSFSNFHSQAYFPMPSLEYHNMAFTVSHKSVSSNNSKVSYYHKGSSQQFSPQLRRGAQGRATNVKRLTRRREELWILLAPSPGSLQSSSPKGPATAHLSCSPPDLKRWKWQPLDVNKPEVGNSTHSVAADPSFSPLLIDSLTAEAILTAFPKQTPRCRL